MQSFGGIAVISVVLAAASCADPRGRFDDFDERVIDANAARADAPLLTSIPDVTGDFLFAVAPSVNPMALFRYRATVRLIDGTTDEPKIEVVLQPLAGDNLEEVGDVVTSVPDPIPVSSTTGEWTADFDGIVPARTNVISRQELYAEFELMGVIRTEDHFCGDANGSVITPFMLDLAGSTFGAVRIPDGMTPADLTPTGVCLASPDDPDAGVPDAMPDASAPDAMPDAGTPDAMPDAMPDAG